MTEAGINSEGTLIISLTNGDGYAYSQSMFTWQKVTESWWAVGSQYWDTSGSSARLDSSSNTDSQAPSVSAGVIPHLERRTTNEALIQGRGRFLQRVVKQVLNREGFEGFETAVSIAHLENRMAAARALNARDEFKNYLLMYAKRIAIEGMKAKVEALLRDLMGRLDVDEDEQDEEPEPDQWVGWDRRELLKAVLLAIGAFSGVMATIDADSKGQASIEIYRESRCPMHGSWESRRRTRWSRVEVLSLGFVSRTAALCFRC